MTSIYSILTHVSARIPPSLRTHRTLKNIFKLVLFYSLSIFFVLFPPIRSFLTDSEPRSLLLIPATTILNPPSLSVGAMFESTAWFIVLTTITSFLSFGIIWVARTSIAFILLPYFLLLLILSLLSANYKKKMGSGVSASIVLVISNVLSSYYDITTGGVLSSSRTLASAKIYTLSALLSLAINILIFPNWATENLRRNLKDGIYKTAALLQIQTQLFPHIAKADVNSEALQKALQDLKEQLQSVQKTFAYISSNLEESRMEISFSFLTTQQSTTIALQLQQMMRYLSTAGHLLLELAANTEVVAIDDEITNQLLALQKACLQELCNSYKKLQVGHRFPSASTTLYRATFNKWLMKLSCGLIKSERAEEIFAKLANPFNEEAQYDKSQEYIMEHILHESQHQLSNIVIDQTSSSMSETQSQLADNVSFMTYHKMDLETVVKSVQRLSFGYLNAVFMTQPHHDTLQDASCKKKIDIYNILVSISAFSILLDKFSGITKKIDKKRHLHFPHLLYIPIKQEKSIEGINEIGDVNSEEIARALSERADHRYFRSFTPPHIVDASKRPNSFVSSFKNGFMSLHKTFKSNNFKYALRLAITVTLFSLFGFDNDTSDWFYRSRAMWGVSAMALTITPTVGESNMIGFYRIAGTTLGGIWGLLPWLMFNKTVNIAGLTAIATLTAIPCFAVIQVSQKYKSLISISLFTFNVVLLGPLIEQLASNLPEVADAWTITIYRTVAINIGVILALLSSIFIFPVYARKALIQTIAHAFYELGCFFDGLMQTVYPLNQNSSIDANTTVIAVESQTVTTFTAEHFIALEFYIQSLIYNCNSFISAASSEFDIIYETTFPREHYEVVLKGIQKMLDDFSFIRLGIHFHREEIVLGIPISSENSIQHTIPLPVVAFKEIVQMTLYHLIVAFNQKFQMPPTDSIIYSSSSSSFPPFPCKHTKCVLLDTGENFLNYVLEDRSEEAVSQSFLLKVALMSLAGTVLQLKELKEEGAILFGKLEFK